MISSYPIEGPQRHEVKNHPNYQLAKSGDYENAVLLAQSFINENLIQKLDNNYKSPIILPIMAEEKQGKNAIPMGMADVINRVSVVLNCPYIYY